MILRYPLMTFLAVVFLCSYVGVHFSFADIDVSQFNEDIKGKIESKVKLSRIPKSELGIWIGESHVGASAIYELNGSELFIPASLSKTFTAYATFKLFPLDHKFKTQLLTNATQEKGVLKGDLFLKGGGDPSFVSQSLWVLVNNFVRTGIKKVQGNIIVDDSLFDSVRYDNSREDARVDRAYDAPVGAMSFNWNSINVYVRPGQVGEAAVVIADPVSSYIKLVNKTTTVKGKGKSIRVSRLADKSHAGDTIIVAGSIGADLSEQVYYKSITQPDIWSGMHLVEFLKQRGIQVEGTVETGVTPSDAKILAELESAELSRVVSDMMKFSNNYVAEMLTKNIATFKSQKQGTISDGVHEVRGVLENQLGFDPSHYNFVNPSGLTRENRFRPKDVAKLYNNAQSDFHFFPEFVSSLAISGVDGTLKDRFSKDISLKVRAKTGLLNGVTALAGYLEQPNGRILTIVFIFNGSQSRIDRAALLFEDMIKALSFARVSGKTP